MKNRHIFAGVLAVVLLTLLIKWSLRPKTPSPAEANAPDTTAEQLASGPTVTSSNAESENQIASRSAVQATVTNVPNLDGTEASQSIADMFAVPIDFYGEVIDESNNPVQGADIKFTWNKLGASNVIETGEASTRSDAGGLFSVEGKKSNGLNVEVKKSGYYTVGRGPFNFQYSQAHGGDIHHPDQRTPVIFHLRKKGVGVRLVTSNHGIRNDLSISAPTDGMPVHVDLLNRTKGQGSLEISQIKPDPKMWKQASQWSFQMSIPDGGFVEYQNEQFPYEAPETGYQTTVQFSFQKGQTNWTDGIAKDFYIRFSNPPLYGRLHVETAIDRGVSLTYAINPDGSRNLESGEP
jgi:hypothetical protein